MSALASAVQLLRSRSWQAIPLAEPISIDALPTPALVIDQDAMERNLGRMTAFLSARGKGMRPHAKNHKCPLIAARQLELGAVGICAAKVSEAAALVHAGIDRVLVTSPVADAARAELLVELARSGATIDVVVDSALGLDVLADATASSDRLGVLVDVDVAMGRTGTRDLDSILALAGRVATTPGLVFRGVQHYAGQVMHLDGRAARQERSLSLWARIAEIVGALADRGFKPEIVTGGGTGTYDIDCDVAALTDLQVGSFIFMDAQYQTIGSTAGPCFDDFEIALQVLARAISQPRQGLITVDAGYKAFAVDAGPPQLLNNQGVSYRFAGDEHGVLIAEPGAALPALGETVRFSTPHCDPTVNLYDWYWVSRDGMAREIWPITARGCSW